MLTDEQIAALRANQRFLAGELQRRGIDVAVFDRKNEILEATYGRHRELLLDIDSSIMPFPASAIASSKSVTRKLLLRENLTVPRAVIAPIEQRAIIEDAVAGLRFPVVVKPAVGSQGEDVYLDIESVQDLSYALDLIEQHRGSVEVLIEEQFEGSEYRIFVTRSGGYAAVLREPAFVVGDGVNPIRLLAERESERRLNPRVNCLGGIVLDGEAERHLRRNGMTFDSVPDAAQKVYLRKASNISLGGFAEDVTEQVHESVLRICLQALAAIPGLPYAGVDFMTADISLPQSDVSYRILELNPLPGIGIHIAPGKGRQRNTASLIADEIFPETAMELGRNFRRAA